MVQTRKMKKSLNSVRKVYRSRLRTSKCRGKGPASCRGTSGCKVASGRKRSFCRKRSNTKRKRGGMVKGTFLFPATIARSRSMKRGGAKLSRRSPLTPGKLHHSKKSSKKVKGHMFSWF